MTPSMAAGGTGGPRCRCGARCCRTGAPGRPAPARAAPRPASPARVSRGAPQSARARATRAPGHAPTPGAAHGHDPGELRAHAGRGSVRRHAARAPLGRGLPRPLRSSPAAGRPRSGLGAPSSPLVYGGGNRGPERLSTTCALRGPAPRGPSGPCSTHSCPHCPLPGRFLRQGCEQGMVPQVEDSGCGLRGVNPSSLPLVQGHQNPSGCAAVTGRDFMH